MQTGRCRAAPTLRRGPGRLVAVYQDHEPARGWYAVSLQAALTCRQPAGTSGKNRADIPASLLSAAAAGGAAALADVAAAGGAHLRAAGHAQRRVGGRPGDQLEQLGRGVGLLDRLRALGGDLLLHLGGL